MQEYIAVAWKDDVAQIQQEYEKNKAAAQSSGSWVNIPAKDAKKDGVEKENMVAQEDPSQWECTGIMVDMSRGGLHIDQNNPFGEERLK